MITQQESIYYISNNLFEKKIDFRNFSNRIIDIIIALILTIPSMMLIFLVFIVFKLLNRDGGPFFYKGQRLGKNKKNFYIYKIRTLKMETEKIVGADPLKIGSSREIRFGKFLRQTRLDELPQLYNIIKGDMTFVGPRPTRKEQYLKYRNLILNYDFRFKVKPGLVGYSQVLTPHSAPKKLRTLLDNNYIRSNTTSMGNIVFLCKTIFILLINLIKESIKMIIDYGRIVLFRGFARDKRRMRRVRNHNYKLKISINDKQFFHEKSEILNVNFEALSIRSSYNFELDQQLDLIIEVKKKNKIKKCQCTGIVHKKRLIKEEDKIYEYIIFYEPVSEMNKYMVDQYVLRQSIVNI